MVMILVLSVYEHLRQSQAVAISQLCKKSKARDYEMMSFLVLFILGGGDIIDLKVTLT